MAIQTLFLYSTKLVNASEPFGKDRYAIFKLLLQFKHLFQMLNLQKVPAKASMHGAGKTENGDLQAMKETKDEVTSKNSASRETAGITEKIQKLPELANIEKIKEFWKNSKKTILLDYDGTLTPIVNNPDDAVPPKNLKEILLKLNKQGKVVICTGRPQAPMDLWIPKEIEVYAEHGAFSRVDGKWKSVFSADADMQKCKEIMADYVNKTPGAMLEEKKAGLVLHYRNATIDFDEKEAFQKLSEACGSNIVQIKKGIEFKIGCKSKICDLVKPDICAGDDTVDERMFEVCKGIAIRVGKEKTFANCFVDDVEAFINLLDVLSQM